MSASARTVLLGLLLVLGAPNSARADLTAFIGGLFRAETGFGDLESTARRTQGLSVGFSLIIVGLEFEWAQTAGDDLGAGACGVIVDVRSACAPALTTGMGNLLLQTPRGLLPVQLYATAGAGVYRARYEVLDENDYGVGTNVGGGAKIELIGPLRVRVDYRVFRLTGGDLVGSTPQRIYIGANVAF
jgi:hypothetical protein